METLNNITFESRAHADFANIYIKDNGKIVNLCYHKLKPSGDIGIEVYSGKNYIVGSNDNSYSRIYNKTNIPAKYINIFNELQTAFNNHYKI